MPETMHKTSGSQELLRYYGEEMQQELHEILNWWMQHMVDEEKGGFYGKLDHHHRVHLHAPKGIVLNSRILWTFAAAYAKTRSQEHLAMAIRAFRYIAERFIDPEHGGAYWSVDGDGKMLDGKKQIYGIAFCIYAFIEYHKATKNGMPLHLAKDMYDYIEKYSHDKQNGGYLEAFTRDWHPIDDLRLSEKDANEKKTMNTHLHVLEAYANLYSVWPDEGLAENIKELLNVFREKIIDPETNHQHLFFDEHWNRKSTAISFGHDIEAAWLLQESAEILGDPFYIDIFKRNAVKMAECAFEGIDSDSGMWHEYDPATRYWLREKHSWPQAEAMVGFLNAWQLNSDDRFLWQSLNSWQFIKTYIKDKDHGEWVWGIDAVGGVMDHEDKAGFWKCPYHSVRACLEILKRTDEQKNG
jgi:cellobiose epimerase